MRNRLRSRRFAPVILVLGLLATAQRGLAQCPVATGVCTPGPASNPQAGTFGMGIFNVNLGTINNTTPGVLDGYRDYSCTQGTTLNVGQDYPIQVRTNAAADENVRVWIDLNNDGQFNPAAAASGGELVFSSVGRNVQSGTVRIGAGATTGVALRMRVSADFANATTLPTPCSTPQYSQVEDYRVTVQANTQAPVASFTADQTTTCSGCVQFTDQSQNGPTSWLWEFGDNTTSTLQNPNKCYTTPGTYTVRLTASNAAGNNTQTRTNYVTYTTQLPVAAACTPGTAAYCCGYGITRVSLGTLVNSSADGSSGYQNFTCAGRVTLAEGANYPITILTGVNPQDTRVWLDLNNDGLFGTNELMLTVLNRTSSVTGNLIIPATALKNVPLRLRIASDQTGTSFGPCSNMQLGQVEDYTVIVQPNTLPPATAFTSNYANSCSNVVSFTDQSQNAPTNWLWTFGDGNTSTQQNPTHTYTASGVYDVTLKATNGFGNTEVTRRAYVALTVPCRQYCASSTFSQNVWITSVQFSGGNLTPPFSSTSVADPNGYGDYTGRLVELRTGQTYTGTVAIAGNFNRVTTVWIDYNRNGVFDNSEIVLNGASVSTYTGTFTVPGTTSTVGLTRMRVLMRLNNTTAPNPCQTNQTNAETEDYSVNITQPSAAGRAQQLIGLEMYPNPSIDGQLQLRLTQPLPGDHQLTVRTVQGARLRARALRFAANGQATIDLSALPRGVYLIELRAPDGATSTQRLLRQ